MYEYHARVRRIVDADTLDLAVDLGFHVAVNVRVRVLDLWAPERHTSAGKAADLFAITLLGDAPEVIVRTKLDRTFDRWLGEIRLPDGTSYAERVIAAGHGTPHKIGA